jgi:hypothetical protein
MDVALEEIGHFDARGMRRVYGRGDHFGRHRSFHMDIWLARDGSLLMRCWSRCGDIDWRSFEIRGVNATIITDREMSAPFQDSWVPDAVRQAYNRWISEEY